MSTLSRRVPAALAALVLTAALDPTARAADVPGPVATAAPAAAEAGTPGCASTHEFFATSCPLTWYGITLYGTYDIGVGWVSHGLRENGYNYEGESLVNKNGNSSQFLIAQNNLSQSGLGIRVKEEFTDGWYVVGNASTGINPQSGDLANMAATNTINAGLPRASYSFVGDGARAGQTFNDEFYGGVSSRELGTLTFGRQRALGTDAMLAYDPASGAYSFSFIGYNGLMAGGGDTQDTRWDSAIKYRIAYGPVHFGAMYKFADGSGGCYSSAAGWTAATCTPEQSHNTALGIDLGAEFAGFSADVVYQQVNQAISVVNPLLGPQSPTQPYQSTVNSINQVQITGANLVDPNNTEYGIVTDNTALMVAAKYVWDPFRFYGGYEHIRYDNPSDPLGIGATAQGGYILSGVEDNNLDSPKVVQVWWTGVRYAFDPHTDIVLSYYHEQQNDFRVPPTCTPASYRASCSGTLNEVSVYLDHHFSKRFDVYAGIAYSNVSGGLAIAIPHGPGVPYYHDDNVAPTIGGRFSF